MILDHYLPVILNLLSGEKICSLTVLGGLVFVSLNACLAEGIYKSICLIKLLLCGCFLILDHYMPVILNCNGQDQNTNGKLVVTIEKETYLVEH